MHGFPQRANALAVNDTDLADPAFPAFVKIVRDQLCDVLRSKSVEVQNTVDWQFQRLRVARISCHVLFSLSGRCVSNHVCMTPSTCSCSA